MKLHVSYNCKELKCEDNRTLRTSNSLIFLFKNFFCHHMRFGFLMSFKITVTALKNKKHTSSNAIFILYEAHY